MLFTRHLGGLVGALAALGFLPLTCWPRRQAPQPPPPPIETRALTGVALRPVRVLLVDDATEVRLAMAGPYRIATPGRSLPLRSGPFLAECTVRSTGTGIRLGGQEFDAPVLELIPTGTAPVEVNSRHYRGKLRVFARQGRLLRVVNIVPLEAYLAGVVGGEMPSYWPAEALKAQAVAARTYALYQMQHRPPGATFDLRADQSSQVYLGLDGETPRLTRLVEETAGIVLTYRGHLFCTYYSSTCGGHTQPGRFVFADGNIPPLAGVPCPYCAGSRFYRWQREVPLEELSAAVNTYLQGRGMRTVGTVETIRVLQRAPSGHVVRIEAVGTEGRAVMTGRTFRRILGTGRLLSTNFAIEPAVGGFRFLGRGFGHGVGLCQTGAKGAAEAGLDFAQILQYYYPRSRLVRLPTAREEFQVSNLLRSREGLLSRRPAGAPNEVR